MTSTLQRKRLTTVQIHKGTSIQLAPERLLRRFFCVSDCGNAIGTCRTFRINILDKLHKKEGQIYLFRPPKTTCKDVCTSA